MVIESSITSGKKMEAYLIPKRGADAVIYEEEDEEEDIGSRSSFSDDEETSDSVVSSSSSSCELTNRDDDDERFEMGSLITQLPFKRGLSKFFDGKSQSFASLSDVSCLGDLAKPAREPEKKRLKPSRSFAGGLVDAHGRFSPRRCSKAIGKRSHLSVLGAAHRRGFLAGGGGAGGRVAG